ncbi:MAG: HAMP domain-containing sensor histidine kinase, partial [Bacteroidota bacterium]
MLPNNRISYVIIASALALIALVFLQVSWINDSKTMIEEQFEQKVRMALCSAVEDLNRHANPGEASVPMCKPVEATQDGFQLADLGRFEYSELDSALVQALIFYDIDLDYEMDVVSENSCVQDANSRKYCCALSPFQKGNTDILSIRFPEKNSYIFGKMKLMLLSSIVILLFITLVFVFATHTLFRQKQILQINKDFFNNMAHEFRTPLTNISLASKLLGKKHGALRENRFVKVVEEESKKLKHQVERVLELASLENGQYPLEKEALQLEQLIREVVDGMALQIKDQGAQVDVQIQAPLPIIEGDKFHLGNVFRNLLDNALKYSREDAKIGITLKRSGNGVMVLFQDQGIGVAKKDQACIFDKYHRVSSGNLHDRKGF